MTTAMLAMLLSLGIFTTRDVVREMSLTYGVDPALSACIVEHESNWNTNLVSKDQDTGLFQVIPSTAAWAAGKLGMAHYDLTNPVDNARIGLWVLKHYPEFYATLYLCD